MQNTPPSQHFSRKQPSTHHGNEVISPQLVMIALNETLPGMNWRDDGRGLVTDTRLTFHAAESLAQFIKLNTHIKHVALHKNTHNSAYGLKIFTPMGLEFLYVNLRKLTSPELLRRLQFNIQMAQNLSNQYFLQHAVQ